MVATPRRTIGSSGQNDGGPVRRREGAERWSRSMAAFLSFSVGAPSGVGRARWGGTVGGTARYVGRVGRRDACACGRVASGVGGRGSRKTMIYHITRYKAVHAPPFFKGLAPGAPACQSIATAHRGDTTTRTGIETAGSGKDLGFWLWPLGASRCKQHLALSQGRTRVTRSLFSQPPSRIGTKTARTSPEWIPGLRLPRRGAQGGVAPPATGYCYRRSGGGLQNAILAFQPPWYKLETP
eukprot:scaffold42462_cov58-Phaeocystis_antarctica.AAC.3